MNTFQGTAYLYPTPTNGPCPIYVAEVTPGHWAAVVAYQTGPRILHTPILPSSTNPDLAQRSLDAFASRRDLQPILHRYGHGMPCPDLHPEP